MIKRGDTSIIPRGNLILLEGDRIILMKYQPSCVFCGSSDNVVPFTEKMICADCVAKLQNKF